MIRSSRYSQELSAALVHSQGLSELSAALRTSRELSWTLRNSRGFLKASIINWNNTIVRRYPVRPFGQTSWEDVMMAVEKTPFDVCGDERNKRLDDEAFKLWMILDGLWRSYMKYGIASRNTQVLRMKVLIDEGQARLRVQRIKKGLTEPESEELDLPDNMEQAEAMVRDDDDDDEDPAASQPIGPTAPTNPTAGQPGGTRLATLMTLLALV